MNKKEIISKVKFRLLEKYTAKNLLPSEEIINDCIDNTLKAINYTRCCESDSELLRDKKELNTWDAFLAGYKKRAEMSGLKYDEVSELHAKTLYKCWKSFDLNP